MSATAKKYSLLSFALVSLLSFSFGHPASALTNGPAAVDEFGQYDQDITDALVPSFTNTIPSFASRVLLRAGMEAPSGTALDATRHRFFVSDTSNNRILVFSLNNDNTFPDRVPDFVLGQSTFNTEAAATTATGVSAPTGLAYDATSDRLFVADSTNNRVIVYDTASITNGESAVNEFGQPSGTAFTSATAATSISGLRTPTGVALDISGNRLFVADRENNRVVVYDITTITNGEDAVNELGQPSGTAFTSATAATSISGMNKPSGVAFDSTNNLLYVADRTNNRVTVYSVSSITNGEDAVNEVGQPSGTAFTSATAATTQAGLNTPTDVALNATGTRLFIADSVNNRVIVHDVSAITNGQNALNVLGQTLFTTSTAATTQAGLRVPTSLAIDAGNSILLVGDKTNNRIIAYDFTAITDGEDAVNELGQSDANNPDPTAHDIIYTKGGINDSPNRYVTQGDVAYAFDYAHNRLFASDQGGNRILVFNLDGSNRLVDKVADFVLGQPDFNSNTFALTQSGVRNARGMSYDAVNDRLFVADNSNKRVLVYDTTSISNGENAVNVLGQADFTTSVNTTSQTLMKSATDVDYDPVNEILYATDQSSNRILIFDVASITDGEPAINVLGQTNFTAFGAAVTQAGMNAAIDAVLDQQHNRLFVMDDFSSRVTVYDVAVITDGEPAINVLGQTNFTSSSTGLSASKFNFGLGIDYDASTGRLFICDFFGTRVLVFDVNVITDGEDAVNVIGQSTFTTSTAATGRSGLGTPSNLAYNASTKELYESDSRNGRNMIFDVSLAAGGGGSSGSCPTPSVVLIIPNGLETFAANSTQPISFGYSGCGVTGIGVQLSWIVDGNAETLPVTPSNVDMARGAAEWTVPNINTTQGRLKLDILSSTGEILASDMSDNVFTITGSTTQPPTTPPSTTPGSSAASQAFMAETIPLTINENLGLTAASQPANPLCVSGSLIKLASDNDPLTQVDSAVYYCGANGKRYVFVNEKTYRTWYADFSSVITISAEALAQIQIGGIVHYRPKQRLLKIQSDPKVYAVGRNGVLHWVTSEAVAVALFGTQWSTTIDDLSDAFFVNYSVGSQLE